MEQDYFMLLCRVISLYFIDFLCLFVLLSLHISTYAVNVTVPDKSLAVICESI